MRRSEVTIIGIILLSFVIGTYFYTQMPEIITSHWDVQGQPNGYMPKIWGLFLMPLISIVLFLFFILIPKIDPLKANIKKFRKYYDRFVVLIIAFLFYLQLLTIFWNIGIGFDIIQFLAPGFGIVFYYCGVLLENTKRNWFIGIKTPWTLSNEKVWEKTNKLGGKLFKISGLVAVFGILFESYALFLILFPMILVLFYTVVYSYVEYRKRAK